MYSFDGFKAMQPIYMNRVKRSDQNRRLWIEICLLQKFNALVFSRSLLRLASSSFAILLHEDVKRKLKQSRWSSSMSGRHKKYKKTADWHQKRKAKNKSMILIEFADIKQDHHRFKSQQTIVFCMKLWSDLHLLSYHEFIIGICMAIQSGFKLKIYQEKLKTLKRGIFYGFPKDSQSIV